MTASNSIFAQAGVVGRPEIIIAPETNVVSVRPMVKFRACAQWPRQCTISGTNMHRQAWPRHIPMCKEARPAAYVLLLLPAGRKQTLDILNRVRQSENDNPVTNLYLSAAARVINSSARTIAPKRMPSANPGRAVLTHQNRTFQHFRFKGFCTAITYRVHANYLPRRTCPKIDDTVMARGLIATSMPNLPASLEAVVVNQAHAAHTAFLQPKALSEH